MTNYDPEVTPVVPMLTTQPIVDLLPRYYEVFGDNPRYTPERIITIDGHQVAWLAFEGVIEYDIMGEGREGQPFSGHELHCACRFEEHVGWEVDEEDGMASHLMAADDCPAKDKAIQLRHHELRTEYLDRGMFDASIPREQQLGGILLDLMQKGERDEFLEGHAGAHFWGGYFYLGTLATIAEAPMSEVWSVARQMERTQQIGLEGAVVQPYREPPEPEWDPFTSLEKDGWVVSAALPAHSKMQQVWQFSATNPAGETIDIATPRLPLSYEPLFGPDISDVNQAQQRMIEIMAELAG